MFDEPALADNDSCFDTSYGQAFRDHPRAGGQPVSLSRERSCGRQDRCNSVVALGRLQSTSIGIVLAESVERLVGVGLFF